MKVNFSFTELWFWAIDIVTIVSFFAFLTSHGDLFDIAFFVFVVLPRLRKFSTIENGLIGYVRKNLVDITFDTTQSED